jgi:uncharacterized RDD family membrane protein YckC
LILSLLLPPAKIGYRTLALLSDFALIALLALFFVWKLWVPIFHTEALVQLRLMIDAHMPQLQEGNLSVFLQQVTTNEALAAMFIQIDRLLFLITWAYYAINAFLLQGGSLGKQMFNLRVLKLSTLRPPNFWDCALRSGVQTLLIFTLWPFLMCFNFCFLCLHPLRRGLHDWFCQTYVVHFGTMEHLREKLKEGTLPGNENVDGSSV